MLSTSLDMPPVLLLAVTLLAVLLLAVTLLATVEPEPPAELEIVPPEPPEPGPAVALVLGWPC